jgi:hypothetical protein
MAEVTPMTRLCRCIPLLALLVSGCARDTGYSTAGVNWSKPGITRDAFRRDEEECDHESHKQAVTRLRQERDDLKKACMQARGYQIVPAKS